MAHHIIYNTAPVETYDVVENETAEHVYNQLDKAVTALETARVIFPASSPIFKDLGDAIQFLIERYENVRHI